MESKTKHRILGVVVLAGLVILAYPFIQRDNAALGDQTAQAMVKAPAFPDQAVQVAATEDETPNAVTTATPAPDTVANAINTSTPETNTAAAVPVQPGRAPAVVSPPASDAASPSSGTAAPTTDQPVQAPQPEQKQPTAKSLKNTSDNSNVQVKAEKPVADLQTAMNEVNEKSTLTLSTKHKKIARLKPHGAQPVIMSKLSRTAAKHAGKVKTLDNNGLLKLKQSAYVIQLGSFKQKSNALRLVNKLRAKGYRAFIQNINVASGESTRVFVGPEQHQASAQIVATELQNNMKLHGIIISYKPFTL